MLGGMPQGTYLWFYSNISEEVSLTLPCPVIVEERRYSKTRDQNIVNISIWLILVYLGIRATTL